MTEDNIQRISTAEFGPNDVLVLHSPNGLSDTQFNRLKAEAASSMSFAKGRLIILEGDMELSVLQNAVPFYQPDQLSPVKAEDQQKPVD